MVQALGSWQWHDNAVNADTEFMYVGLAALAALIVNKFIDRI